MSWVECGKGLGLGALSLIEADKHNGGAHNDVGDVPERTMLNHLLGDITGGAPIDSGNRKGLARDGGGPGKEVPSDSPRHQESDADGDTEWGDVHKGITVVAQTRSPSQWTYQPGGPIECPQLEW